MLTALALIILVGFPIWFVIHTVGNYKAADPALTRWQKLYTATKNSATFFWGMAITAVTFALNGILQVLQAVGVGPEFQNFVNSSFTVPVASGIIVAVIAILALARARTIGASKD